MSVPPPHQRNTSGSSFGQRLAYYLVGVAIGCVALGFLWNARQKAAGQAGQTPAAQAAEAEAGGAPGTADPTGGDPEVGVVRETRDYVFVLIRTGPLSEPTPEQTQTAMAGHFANMGRLAEAGKLLMAGPLGEPRAEPDHRGLWVFDAETVEEGLGLGETDPAVEMGVFRLEGAVFRTGDPLTELLRLEEEDEARRLADPAQPAWEGRGYIIAVGTPEATAGYERGEGVLIEGVLVGGPSNTVSGEASRRMLVLDASTPEAARELLGDSAGAWSLRGWYGSKMIAELPDVSAGD